MQREAFHSMMLMMKFHNYLKDFLHLVYPEVCMGCGSDEVSGEQMLCAQCFHSLPATGFFGMEDNPVAQKFYGREKIAHAASAYFYSKDSLIQRLLAALKYKQDRDCGRYLGILLLNQMLQSQWLADIDLLIPLPLSKERKFQRGYNQSTLLAEPMSEKTGVPIEEEVVVRTVNTETQTHKTREERWNSMQNIFRVTDPDKLKGKHVLVIDDVLTTGATLEVLCNTILRVPRVQVSVATFACAM